MNFSKHFLKNVSRFKARYKKTMRFTQCIAQVGMMLHKKKKCTILRLILNILPFLIVIASLLHKWRSIKFLKHFLKEGLNFCQMTLCCLYDFMTLHCVFFLVQHIHLQQIKTRITCENLWLNTGENQKIPILLKSYLLIFTQLKYLCKLLSSFQEVYTH